MLVNQNFLRSLFQHCHVRSVWRLVSNQTAVTFLVALAFSAATGVADTNLLKNPGFEETALDPENAPAWHTAADSVGKAVLTAKEVHQGQKAISLPPNTSIEQTIPSAAAGAYLARCWVKSEAAQTLTFLLRNTEAPWAGYTCAELNVPQGQWVQIEAFCVMDQSGSLSLSLGGVSKTFHPYHGTEQDMASPIVADDFELVRYEGEPARSDSVKVWDARKEPAAKLDWSDKDHGSPVDSPAHAFEGMPIIQGRHLVGTWRQADGALTVYSVQEGKLEKRCVVAPSPAIPSPKYAMVQDADRAGIRVSSASGSSYTAWFTSQGLLRLEPRQVARFQIQECRLRYGLLPSFVGSDIVYNPAAMPATKEFHLPSTQWFVGLVEGNNALLVAAWETNSQAVSVGLIGEKQNRVIDSLSIGAEHGSLGLSFVEHTNLWHREQLNEDWLGDYVPIAWERPFPARWMGHFTVSPGATPSFRQPNMNYSFPFACAKTRMWGVWFEDWNHYPFYFDGPRTMFHFEKTFIPQGEALLYFLEPAAAALYSPCEIVEQFLGSARAAALFDFEANRLRKLKYSTPDQFIFDRPVCATTTRLSQIKQGEKATVGVDLATHLYEFIREIRARVDQYTAFFAQMKDYFASEEKAHPETREYLAGLQKMVEEAQANSREIYATPLSAVETKIDAMKTELRAGQGDGYNCGNLDVRSPAGAQDDLCRRYNRCVLKLTQSAAWNCGDSPEKAAIALHVWEQSRQVLRRPTRWEPRRTLYFFEP